MLLTTVDEWQFVELSLADHAGEVLEFFERNRDFFVTVEGTTPGLKLVKETFTWVPDGVQPHQKQIVGVYRDQRLFSFIELVRDRHRADEWLLSLFMIDIDDRRLGFGRRVIDALEAHLSSLGVTCLLLGVVEGNDSAMAFWERMNYIPTEVCEGPEGKRIRTFYKELCSKS